MMDEKAFQQDVPAIEHYLWIGVVKGKETAQDQYKAETSSHREGACE